MNLIRITFSLTLLKDIEFEYLYFQYILLQMQILGAWKTILYYFYSMIQS